MVVRFKPSRFERRIEPSFTLGLPMLVQYKWPAAISMASPSGSFLPSSTSVVRPVPSGLADSTRPAARSRKNSRPTSAGGRCAALVDLGTIVLMRESSVTLLLNSRGNHDHGPLPRDYSRREGTY